MKTSNIHIGNTAETKVYPIDTNLLISYAQGDFPATCDADFAAAIGGSYTKSQFFADLLTATINQYPAGAPNTPAHDPNWSADTDSTAPGRPINLFPNFYGTAAQHTSNRRREFTVIHEQVHRFTGWTDNDIFSHFASYGLIEVNNSDDFTKWIYDNCPNPWTPKSEDQYP